MRAVWRVLIPIVCAGTTALAQRGGAELVVSGDGIVPAAVNGVPGRIRVDPAAPAVPLLSTRWAGEAGLRPSMLAGRYAVGPQEVPGASAVARIGVGAGAPARRRRVGWTQRPYLTGADGVVGPGGLPQQVIRFQLRPARPGERTVAFRLVDEGGMFGGWGASYALVDLGGAPLRVRFDPHRPRTLATAGAGLRLAEALGGRLADDAQAVEIAFGIARPVRTLRLARPLTIGPLAIATLGVRTRDFGNAEGIQPDGGDPDEIVVTAPGRRTVARDRIALGADVLARCSSITFDRRARQVRLSCG